MICDNCGKLVEYKDYNTVYEDRGIEGTKEIIIGYICGKCGHVEKHE